MPNWAARPWLLFRPRRPRLGVRHRCRSRRWVLCPGRFVDAWRCTPTSRPGTSARDWYTCDRPAWGGPAVLLLSPGSPTDPIAGDPSGPPLQPLLTSPPRCGRSGNNSGEFGAARAPLPMPGAPAGMKPTSFSVSLDLSVLDPHRTHRPAAWSDRVRVQHPCITGCITAWIRSALDKNYGGILIIWDRLFGSFQPEMFRPHYGSTKPVDTFNVSGSWRPSSTWRSRATSGRRPDGATNSATSSARPVLVRRYR